MSRLADRAGKIDYIAARTIIPKTNPARTPPSLVHGTLEHAVDFLIGVRAAGIRALRLVKRLLSQGSDFIQLLVGNTTAQQEDCGSRHRERDGSSESGNHGESTP
jgi:hypothetical protein